jgi:hypothetical protein
MANKLVGKKQISETKNVTSMKQQRTGYETDFSNDFLRLASTPSSTSQYWSTGSCLLFCLCTMKYGTFTDEREMYAGEEKKT